MDTRTHETVPSTAPSAAVDCEVTCRLVPYESLHRALGRTPYVLW
jgi:hypothetical protein